MAFDDNDWTTDPNEVPISGYEGKDHINLSPTEENNQRVLDVNNPNTTVDLIKKGLNTTNTYLGFHDGVEWKSYISSIGTFKFNGDNDNYIEWNGSALNIRGSLNADDISTGNLESTNWSTTQGSQFNLNDGTFKLGGSSNPKLSWNGTTLSVIGNIDVQNPDDVIDAINNGTNTVTNVGPANGDEIIDAINTEGTTLISADRVEIGGGGIVVGQTDVKLANGLSTKTSYLQRILTDFAFYISGWNPSCVIKFIGTGILGGGDTSPYSNSPRTYRIHEHPDTYFEFISPSPYFMHLYFDNPIADGTHVQNWYGGLRAKFVKDGVDTIIHEAPNMINIKVTDSNTLSIALQTTMFVPFSQGFSEGELIFEATNMENFPNESILGANLLNVSSSRVYIHHQNI